MNDKLERKLILLFASCGVLVTLTLVSAIGVDIYLKLKNQGSRNVNVLEVKP